MTITFYSKTAGYEWLSNFSEHGFVLDNAYWPSVEHYYQAQKFPGTKAAQQIRVAETALIAKTMSQDPTLVVRADWPNVKETVMKRALREKFFQNKSILDRLLNTGDEELVHFSNQDHFWGRDNNGRGENRLGILLMELRNELRPEKPHSQ
jgi:ribA/ribD-fused uncharacterized protein